MIRQTGCEIALRLAATEAELASLGAHLALSRARGEPDRELRRRRDSLLGQRWQLVNVDRFRAYGRRYSRAYRKREVPA